MRSPPSPAFKKLVLALKKVAPPFQLFLFAFVCLDFIGSEAWYLFLLFFALQFCIDYACYVSWKQSLECFWKVDV